jgi:putative hydrolase of the HAD superfamily
MSEVRAVILDFDGLILETESACYGGWRALFQAHGADYALEEYQRILGTEEDPLALFEERCGRPANWNALHLHRREVENRLNATLVPQPGVIALLDQARSLGLRLGVASSSPHRWVDRHLANHGLLERFDTVVCREDVARAKPEPDLYLEALRRFDLTPDRAIAFEDSHNGSLAAKRAGLRCVAVPTPMTATQDFRHVNLVLPTLEDVNLGDIFARLAGL